jgi:hypothetical protein
MGVVERYQCDDLDRYTGVGLVKFLVGLALRGLVFESVLVPRSFTKKNPDEGALRPTI